MALYHLRNDFISRGKGQSVVAAAAYRARFPNDVAATDLSNWHAFEEDNPDTFIEMYQFWVQKA